jgi:MEMO1 family protein
MQDLLKNPAFEVMQEEVDEAEHSIELHLPFIATLFKQSRTNVKIVPVLIGHISKSTLHALSTALLPYFTSLSTLFIISSDFCHYGKRFRYTPQPTSPTPLHAYIKTLDMQAFDLIRSKDLGGFRKYLDETGNTICGSAPLTVLLGMLEMRGKDDVVELLGYDQSSKAEVEGSSVSYLSARVSVERV